jgi:flagellar secretion chaperone FliS
MSYGTYAGHVGTYREMEVRSASPGELVVMLYDHLLKHLGRVRLLLEPSSISARSDALQVCRTTLSELLVTLDRERGGDLATHLAAIYSFLLGELATLGLRPDAPRVERIISIVSGLREAFAVAAASTPSSATVA